jgi:hypothetical protein
MRFAPDPAVISGLVSGLVALAIVDTLANEAAPAQAIKRRRVSKNFIGLAAQRRPI